MQTIEEINSEERFVSNKSLRVKKNIGSSAWVQITNGSLSVHGDIEKGARIYVINGSLIVKGSIHSSVKIFMIVTHPEKILNNEAGVKPSYQTFLETVKQGLDKWVDGPLQVNTGGFNNERRHVRSANVNLNIKSSSYFIGHVNFDNKLYTHGTVNLCQQDGKEIHIITNHIDKATRDDTEFAFFSSLNVVKLPKLEDCDQVAAVINGELYHGTKMTFYGDAIDVENSEPFFINLQGTINQDVRIICDPRIGVRGLPLINFEYNKAETVELDNTATSSSLGTHSLFAEKRVIAAPEPAATNSDSPTQH